MYTDLYVLHFVVRVKGAKLRTRCVSGRYMRVCLWLFRFINYPRRAEYKKKGKNEWKPKNTARAAFYR